MPPHEYYGDVIPDTELVDAKGRPLVENMTTADMLRELVTTVRAIADGLENFDPSSLLAGILGGGSGESNPMAAILGSLVKQ